MAKDLPYFKFFCSEWNDGDITLEDLKTQGLYINICAYYWSNNCEITLEKLQKKFKTNKKQIENLVKAKIIKLDSEKNVLINFLIEQNMERENLSNQNSINALKRWKEKKEKSDRNATASNSQCENDAIKKRGEEKRGEEKRKDKNTLPKNKFSEFKEFQQIFLDFYKLKTGEEYYWTAKDAGKVKSLVSKLKFKIKEKSSAKKEITDAEATKGFAHLLNMIADNWLLSNLSMSIIDSKFNEIISNNGKSNTKATNGNRAELEELSRRIKARNNATENGRVSS